MGSITTWFHRFLFPVIVFCLLSTALPPSLGPVLMDWESPLETQGFANPQTEEWASPRRVSRQVTPRLDASLALQIPLRILFWDRLRGIDHPVVPRAFKAHRLRNGIGRPLNP